MKTTEHNLKIDLHVHSPASLDYLGDKSPRSYAALVKAFVDEEVDAIAITDHNSVEGYFEYCRQAQASRETYRLMAARDDSAQVVKDLKSEVERFDKLRVFAGVEISCYPSIHIILIFDDSVACEASRFLAEALELGETATTGDPKNCSKLSPNAVLDKATSAFGDKFFCVLPHVESSKGAWAELEGIARANLFRDARVLAVQYSNPATTERITTALKCTEYKRETPLSFIQCSDYHGAPNIKPASQYSVLKGDRLLDFTTLKIALSNPSNVRCSSEFVDARLDAYTANRPTTTFEFTNKLDIDSERRKDLARALCGILNSQRGIIRINLLNMAESDSRTA